LVFNRWPLDLFGLRGGVVRAYLLALWLNHTTTKGLDILFISDGALERGEEQVAVAVVTSSSFELILDLERNIEEASILHYLNLCCLARQLRFSCSLEQRLVHNLDNDGT